MHYFKKSKAILVVLFLSLSTMGKAQDAGKPILRIFSNFHQGISSEVTDQTAFEILRAYLGYEHTYSENWSARVILDIGSPDDLSQYSLIRRYAYFKNAFLSYQTDRFKTNIGLIDMHHIDFPERYWNHRYVLKEFQDQYKFGPKSDIGIMATYKITKKTEIDAFVVNGEGSQNLQRDDTYRFGGGVSFKPVSKLALRMHYDVTPKQNIQQNFSLFAGYRADQKYTLGLLGVYKHNADFTENRKLYGISIFGMYAMNDRWEIFLRHDRMSSNIPADYTVPWNLSRDGSSITGGIQYRATDFLRLALNYQDWYSAAQNGPDNSWIYLNLEVSL